MYFDITHHGKNNNKAKNNPNQPPKSQQKETEIFLRSLTYHIDGASVPLISKKSYPSSNWKSVKTKAIVSPGSANMVQVQSALFSYSEGKWGLEIAPLVPRSVPPQAPSAEEQSINYYWTCTLNKCFWHKPKSSVHKIQVHTERKTKILPRWME